MKHLYKTKGTCSQNIQFDLEEGLVHNVVFKDGCNGNLQAIGRLVEGKTVEEIESLLKGINCGRRGTSCADQLAKAVRRAKDGSPAG